jgi:hypothetical protein
MNLEIELLKELPCLFDALNALVEDYDIYFYLVFVWVALAVIAWIAGGGLRKRLKGKTATIIPVIIIAQPPRQPPSPIIDIEVEHTWGNDDETTGRL